MRRLFCIAVLVWCAAAPAWAGVDGRKRVVDPNNILPPSAAVELVEIIDHMWERHRIDVLVVMPEVWDLERDAREAVVDYYGRWNKRRANLGQLLLYYDMRGRRVAVAAEQVDQSRQVTAQELRVVMRASMPDEVRTAAVGEAMITALRHADALIERRRTREVRFNVGWYLLAAGFVIIFVVAGRTVREGRFRAAERRSRPATMTRPLTSVRHGLPDGEFGDRVKWWWG